MTELAGRGRRPPPAPPPLQRYAALTPTPIDIASDRPDPVLLERLQPRPNGTPTRLNTTPQPFHLEEKMPRLITQAPASNDDIKEYLPNHRVIIPRRLTWVALMSWLFGVCVLILVVVPTNAIPKLMGPFQQPVSASAFGPLIAIFAIIAILIAAGGGLWLWAAMGHEYSSAPNEPGDQE